MLANGSSNGAYVMQYLVANAILKVLCVSRTWRDDNLISIRRYDVSVRTRSVPFWWRKLKTAWDRRIVVRNARKLAESAKCRRSVYVTWDESLNVRRRNTRKKFKERTVSEEVKATVEGALFVDNVLVLSIKDGFAKRSAAGSTSHDVRHIISDLCLRVISYNCRVF